MRALSTAQQASYASVARDVRARVFVDKNGAGSFVDLTTLEGYDFVEGISYDESVDAPVAAASIALHRSVHDLSLSPLMSYSKLNNPTTLPLTPTLHPGRSIYIETQVVPEGAPILSTSWVRVFDGYIDEVDPSGETLSIDARDKGARLQDAFIETEKEYGTLAGRAMHLVMQDIITDHFNILGLGTVTLYTPVSPTFLVYKYLQDKVPVMDALVALADQIGWAVRYRWDAGTSAFRLTLYDINRENTTAAYTFGPDDYYDLTSLRTSLKDIRNAVDVVFYDRANSMRAKATVVDSASIAKYGRRYMSITEESSSQIDTMAEATTFSTAILKDLREPYAEQSVTVDYFWPAELQDLYAFLPNGKHYDLTQLFAVQNLKHKIDAEGKGTTSITTRGKPATAYRRWLRIEGRPGVAPGSGYRDPPTAGAIVAYSSIAGVVVECTVSDMDNWDRTDVFLDTVAIADPGVDSTTQKYKPLPVGLRKASGRLTRFTVQGLTIGTLYYGRVQVMDLNGNLSPASAQFSVIAQKVGPVHTNLESAQAGLLLNADLNIYSAGVGTNPASPVSMVPPDFWFSNMWAPALGTGLRGANTSTTAASGNYAVRMQTGNAADTTSEYILIWSDFVPYAGNDIVSASMFARYTATPINSIYDTLAIQFFDVNKTFIGRTYYAGSGSSSVATTYALGFQFSCLTPVATRYIQVEVRIHSSSASAFLVDRVGITRGRPQLAAVCTRAPGVLGYDDSSLEEDMDYTLPTGTAVLNNNVGWTWIPGGVHWQAQMCGQFTFTAGCSFTHNNIDPANNWCAMWIEHSADGGATWAVIGRCSGLTDEDGNVDMNCTSTSIAIEVGHLVRLRYRSTESGRFHNQLNAPSGRPSNFTGNCISRGDA
jgi:hypothetical protein